MKKLPFIILLIIMMPGIFAQHMPPGINYQAVARDNAGNELKSQNLNIRVSVVRNDPTGMVEYSETHSVTTDKFGLFNLIIGQGSYYAGEKSEFMDINWGDGPHFLRVEADFGQGFIAMGTMQFLAVPYALYAANAGSTSGEEDRDKDPENELQILSLEGQVLQLKQGNIVTNSVTLSDVVNDADADPENERQDLDIDQDHKLRITNNPNASVINLSPYLDNTDSQTLSKTRNSIRISGGNSIIADVDSTNELQTLNSSRGKLSISKGNGQGELMQVDIFDADADSTNELQTLGSSRGKISISRGNGQGELMQVDVFDADADSTNELQTLSSSRGKISISKGNGQGELMQVDVFDADADSTNELQTLSSSRGKISISKGNGQGELMQVDVFDADADSTNELQTLNSSPGKLSISGANGQGVLKEVDISDADADPQNELQNLAIDGYNLSISETNTVNIRPQLIAFRAFKDYGELYINPGDSAFLAFDKVKLSIPSDIFNPFNGTFTVPAGGEGLYSFRITYDYYNTNQKLIILRNGITEEVIFEGFSTGISGAKSFEFIYNLAEGETIQIYLKITSNPASQTAPAVFSGYRIH